MDSSINITGALNARADEARHPVGTFSDVRKLDKIRIIGLLDEFDFAPRNNEVCYAGGSICFLV